MLYNIQVTEDDILHGTRSNCISCPVARAIKRITGKPVKVGLSRIYEDDGREYENFETRILVHELPREVSNFIHNFDRFYPVEPFEFQIEL